MKVQGIIKSIGQGREWSTKDGAARKSYPVEIEVPFVNSRGEKRADGIIGDLTVGNDEFVKKLQELADKQSKVEADVFFTVRDWQGRKFQNCRIGDITVLI